MCFSLKYLSGSIYFVQAEFLNNSWVKELMSLKKLTRQKLKNKQIKTEVFPHCWWLSASIM